MHKDTPLKLLILYQMDVHGIKKQEAVALQTVLTSLGHEVIIANAAEAKITDSPDGKVLQHKGTTVTLSTFDGAMLRVSPEKIGQWGDILHNNNIIIYQDVPMLIAGSDKLRSQKVFEQHGIPTPRTYGAMHDDVEIPGALDTFLTSLGNGPYVVKKSYGWGGNLVKVVDDTTNAKRLFYKWQDDNKTKRRGGVLAQEFIESDPSLRSAYRVHTIVGTNENGEPEAKIVGASIRLGKPGGKTASSETGAEELRVGLDEAEAYDFHVTRGKMPPTEFHAKVKTGDIRILPAAVGKVALDASLAFGPGSWGPDVVVDMKTGKSKVLEMNPFAADYNFEYPGFGFSLNKPWAGAFAGYVAHEKSKARSTSAAARVIESRGDGDEIARGGKRTEPTPRPDWKGSI